MLVHLRSAQLQTSLKQPLIMSGLTVSASLLSLLQLHDRDSHDQGERVSSCMHLITSERLHLCFITLLLLLSFAAAPTIAMAMGERGVITHLLAAKYGSHLTFAAMRHV